MKATTSMCQGIVFHLALVSAVCITSGLSSLVAAPDFVFPSSFSTASKESGILYMPPNIISLGGTSNSRSFEYCSLAASGFCHVLSNNLPLDGSGVEFAVHNGSRIVACEGATRAGGSTCFKVDMDSHDRQHFPSVGGWSVCHSSLSPVSNAKLISSGQLIYLVARDGRFSAFSFECSLSPTLDQRLDLLENESLVPDATGCSAAGLIALAVHNASSGTTYVVSFLPNDAALNRVGEVASLPAGFDMAAASSFGSVCVIANGTDVGGFFVTATTSDPSLLNPPFDLGLPLVPHASRQKLVVVAEKVVLVDTDGSVRVIPLFSGLSPQSVTVASSRASVRHLEILVSNEVTILIALHDGFQSTSNLALSFDETCAMTASPSSALAPVGGSVAAGALSFDLPPPQLNHSSMLFSGSLYVCYSIGDYGSSQQCGGVSTNGSPGACWQLGCFYNSSGCFHFASATMQTSKYFLLVPLPLDSSTRTVEHGTGTGTLRTTLTRSRNLHVTTSEGHRSSSSLSSSLTIRLTPSHTRIVKRTRSPSSTAVGTSTVSHYSSPTKTYLMSATSSLLVTPSGTFSVTSTTTATATTTRTESATSTATSTSTRTATRSQSSTESFTTSTTATASSTLSWTLTTRRRSPTVSSSDDTDSGSLSGRLTRSRTHVLSATHTLRPTRTQTNTTTLQREHVINTPQTGSSIQFSEQMVLGLGVVFLALMTVTMGVLVVKKVLLQRRRARQNSYTSEADFFRRFEESFTGVQADD